MILLQVWQQVKAANPGFSICEIGATIGRMWRELADEEKQRHMEDFNKDKVGQVLRQIDCGCSLCGMLMDSKCQANEYVHFSVFCIRDCHLLFHNVVT